jgi:hypothetical protein
MTCFVVGMAAGINVSTESGACITLELKRYEIC